MARSVKISKSNKCGFRGQESYIVTRGRTSYLRIVGNEPIYSLMTATASEDDKSYRVCGERVRLISSALQLGTALKTHPSRENDSSGRGFIRICDIPFPPGKDQDGLDLLNEILSNFFELFDKSDLASLEAISEMREIYLEFSDSDSNEDVYLSDGVWLSFDGKLHDRGK